MARQSRFGLAVAALTLLSLAGLVGVATARTVARQSPASGDRPVKIIAELRDNGSVKLTLMTAGEISQLTDDIASSLTAMASQFDVDEIRLVGETDSLAVQALQRDLHSSGLATAVHMRPASPSGQLLPATFPVRLSAGDTVTVKVYDQAGSHIETLHHGYMAAGDHSLSWAAEDFLPPPGLYFVSIEAPGYRQMRKVIVRE